MKIYRVTDKEFKEYGAVIDVDASEIIAVAEKITLPESGSAYEPSREDFETTEFANAIQRKVFGEIKTQTGYCYGHSNMLNALEWHKNSEVNVAVTDMILLLGRIQDIEDGKYNSEKVKAFEVKKGEVIEVYATTMHFCPIETTASGFGCVVVLPVGTNLVLDEPSTDEFLFKKNKWIMAHVDNADLISKGVKPGIYGENYKL